MPSTSTQHDRSRRRTQSDAHLSRSHRSSTSPSDRVTPTSSSIRRREALTRRRPSVKLQAAEIDQRILRDSRDASHKIARAGAISPTQSTVSILTSSSSSSGSTVTPKTSASTRSIRSQTFTAAAPPPQLHAYVEDDVAEASDSSEASDHEASDAESSGTSATTLSQSGQSSPEIIKQPPIKSDESQPGPGHFERDAHISIVPTIEEEAEPNEKFSAPVNFDVATSSNDSTSAPEDSSGALTVVQHLEGAPWPPTPAIPSMHRSTQQRRQRRQSTSQPAFSTMMPPQPPPYYTQHSPWMGQHLAYQSRPPMQPYFHGHPSIPSQNAPGHVFPPSPVSAYSQSPGYAAYNAYQDRSRDRSDPRHGEAGYEYLAEQLADHKSLNTEPGARKLYRRFEVLQHRVLLSLQDELQVLEHQLRECDEAIAAWEIAEYNGQRQEGSRRIDVSMAHIDVNRQRRLDLVYAVGDKFNEYQRALTNFKTLNTGFSAAAPKTIVAYKQWLEEHGAVLCGTESLFLNSGADLVDLQHPMELGNSHSSVATLLDQVFHILFGSSVSVSGRNSGDENLTSRPRFIVGSIACAIASSLLFYLIFRHGVNLLGLLTLAVCVCSGMALMKGALSDREASIGMICYGIVLSMGMVLCL